MPEPLGYIEYSFPSWSKQGEFPYGEQAGRARVVWHLAACAILISGTRNRSECIAEWKFIKLITALKLS